MPLVVGPGREVLTGDHIGANDAAQFACLWTYIFVLLDGIAREVLYVADKHVWVLFIFVSSHNLHYVKLTPKLELFPSFP